MDPTPEQILGSDYKPAMKVLEFLCWREDQLSKLQEGVPEIEDDPSAEEIAMAVYGMQPTTEQEQEVNRLCVRLAEAGLIDRVDEQGGPAR